MARVISSTTHEARPLDNGWELAAPARPVALSEVGRLTWIPAQVPGTAAGALRAAGQWRAGDPPDFDERQIWYRCSFEGSSGAPGTRVLRFDGLATLCDAWVNGVHVLRSESMYAAHALDVGAHLHGRNQLLLRFSPLAEELKKRRPRPRWKTGLARNQQLRFFRTTLMGRIPSWPLEAPVGPWRDVTYEERSRFAVEAADLRCSLDGEAGVARLSLRLQPLGGAARPGRGVFSVGEASAELSEDPHGELSGEVRLEAVSRWWPATHGQPSLHPAQVRIGEDRVDLGKVGFRSVVADRAGGAFSLAINGVPLFCRGANWTPLDVDTLNATPARLRAALELVRHCGMNMLRLAGPFVYETPAFHQLCDELGILVWQDLMFAALDYPDAEPAWLELARAEAAQVARQLQGGPSLAVFCGGSDSLQQPAMFGLPQEQWKSAFFDVELERISRAVLPDIPYVENSPSGADPAYHVDHGIAHYFGVGAYRRPLEDARRSNVRFAAECLAFANVPGQELLDSWLGNAGPVSHPRWKEGVPRDSGAGWDFDDVRDHYFRLVYGLDPERVRSEDPQRYVSLSRVLTGEVMEAVLSEWRAGDTCRGALIWTWKDFRPGAGWGLIDAHGAPKAAYWLLRRALRPVTLLMTDEGLNGVRLYVANDTDQPFEGEIEVLLLRGELSIADGRVGLRVPARGLTSMQAHRALGRFHDVSYAYRFGPPQHDVVLGRLLSPGGEMLSEAALFPAGRERLLTAEPHLEARAVPDGPGAFVLHLRARRFAYAVELALEGPVQPDDNYVHVAPGKGRSIRVNARGAAQLRGEARPLNGAAVRIAADAAEPDAG